MKILIPSHNFGPWGGQRVLSELANEWIKKGHHVTFLVNESSPQPYFPTNGEIIWTNYMGQIIQNSNSRKIRRTKINGWLNLLGINIALNKIGKNYDVIFANQSLIAWSVKYANCKKAKKMYYIQAYEPDYYTYDKKIKTIILRLLSKTSYNLNLKQICNSPVYIGYKNIKANVWVPPGINFNLFYKKKILKDFSKEKEIILGCIGRKEPVKGTQFVLKAFEILYSEDNRFRLHIAFGNLPNDYSHPGVSIVSSQNDKQLSDFYRSLDIMIAPGTVQLGAPHYPVMEAMACGVPVITTGYMPANEKNSWIVKVGSADSIVSATNKLINDISYTDKVLVASRDIAEFEWENVARKMLKIISL